MCDARQIFDENSGHRVLNQKGQFHRIVEVKQSSQLNVKVQLFIAEIRAVCAPLHPIPNDGLWVNEDDTWQKIDTQWLQIAVKAERVKVEDGNIDRPRDDRGEL